MRNIHFHDTDNDQILAYSKVDALTGNCILVVVNLDSFNAQGATVRLDLTKLGVTGTFPVHDLVTGASYTWGSDNYVELRPWDDVAHIFVLPEVPEERREALAWREVTEYRS